MEIDAQTALERRSLLLSQEQQMPALKQEHLQVLIRRHTKGFSFIEYELLDQQIKCLENAMFQLEESFIVAKQCLVVQQESLIAAKQAYESGCKNA